MSEHRTFRRPSLLSRVGVTVRQWFDSDHFPGGPDAAFVRSMLEYMWQPLLDAIEKVRRGLLSLMAPDASCG